MNPADVSHEIAGCEIKPLNKATCEDYLSWLISEGKAQAPAEAAGLVCTLAHCDDGVTWGRYDEAAGAWRLGSQVAPDVSPPIRPQTLQELRIFGEKGEVLIWRTDAGLRGRLLREAEPPANRNDENDPLRPSDESRLLRGDRVLGSLDHGFTHVGDGKGAEQVLPLAVTSGQLRSGRVHLVVRHYFEADRATGAVRVAAARLVRLISGASHGA